MESKVKILLSYIEQCEKGYSDNMAGLELFLDGLVANNDDPIQTISKELQDDLKTYLTIQ